MCRALYYETAVLRGARRLLEDAGPVVLMEVFNYDVFTGDKPELEGRISAEAVNEVERIMRDAGYTFYAIGQKGILRVKDLRSIPDGGSNYLFSRVVLERPYTPFRDERAFLALLGGETRPRSAPRESVATA
jgi:hypothetical protein